MDSPAYVVINPMHLKVVMHGYVDRHGPLKMKEKYIQDNEDVRSYYMRNIFRTGYLPDRWGLQVISPSGNKTVTGSY